MSRSVYNYTISVLKKVSFNQILFNKELNKASKRLAKAKHGFNWPRKQSNSMASLIYFLPTKLIFNRLL